MGGLEFCTTLLILIFVTESCSFEGRDQSQRRPYQGEAGTYEKAININSSCLTYGIVKQLKFNIPTMVLVTINISLPDVYTVVLWFLVLMMSSAAEF